MSKVFELGAHTNMKPDEVLDMCKREGFDELIVVGYIGKDFVVRSSKMDNRTALWLIKHAEMHALGYDD